VTTAHDLLILCRRHLDPNAQSVTLHAGHNRTTVLRAATRHGDVIVKIHRDPHRHRQERNAYRCWVPVLGERAPRLLAEIDDPPAIIITSLPGTPVAELALPPEVEKDVYHQAGAILKAWHAAQPPRYIPDMAAWLADRGEKWLKLAEAILPASDQAETHMHLRELAKLGPVPAMPCHLDFTPRNLLRAANGAVGVIDFEHARYDLAGRDLVRLTSRIWRDRPDLEDAFMASYGSLTDLDRPVIEHCIHLDKLTAVVRSTGRNPPPVTPS
jgi:Ser/Thr protein kinase RdoA (MazF antagonist)